MSLLNAFNPVVTACLAAVFLGERLAARQVFGVAFSVGGVGLVVTGGDWTVLTGLAFNTGDILLALAPMSWAAYSIIGRRVMRGVTPLAATAWASVAGTAMLFLLALADGFNGRIALSALGWVSMAYMILGSGCLAFLWWNQGVAVVGPTRAAMFINIMPIAGMAFAALLMHERIGWQQLIGAALIISGVWLTTQHPGKKG
jgi:drug/metabolite transporter (DMT)-like permease